MKKVCLFIIDPQIDFCDPKGQLYVGGADLDSVRLGNFIKKNYPKIDDIALTLDSHHRVHVAHALSWLDSSGKHPDPFTPISADDVRTGKFRAYNPQFQQRYLDYVETLEKNGRYILCIWPEHCLIGSVGAAIVQPIWEGLHLWEGQYAVANKVTKGSNLFTEHYSAVKADVEDWADPLTKLNTNLVELLKEYDEILISGQALSHCVANTIRDVANEFSDDEVKKFVLLEDTTSSVTGFEGLGQQFVSDLTAKGLRVSTTQTYRFE